MQLEPYRKHQGVPLTLLLDQQLYTLYKNTEGANCRERHMKQGVRKSHSHRTKLGKKMEVWGIPGYSHHQTCDSGTTAPTFLTHPSKKWEILLLTPKLSGNLLPRNTRSKQYLLAYKKEIKQGCTHRKTCKIKNRNKHGNKRRVGARHSLNPALWVKGHPSATQRPATCQDGQSYAEMKNHVVVADVGLTAVPKPLKSSLGSKLSSDLKLCQHYSE